MPRSKRKIAVYLRRIQGAHGGWPLFHDGDFDMSASVKAYFALKMIGDAIDAPHMARAREAILARGGAARANVFTRIMLALFGFIPWRAVPVMPVEIMLLPKWFPFHLDKISYWSRTVIVPLLVLMALKPQARNPKGVRIDELFLEPPATHRAGAEGAAAEGVVVLVLPRRRQRAARRPSRVSRSARASAPSIARSPGSTERLNGEDGLGAIYPGDGQQRDDVRRARLSGRTIRSARSRARSIEKLLVVHDARGLLPALRLADLGHRRSPATRCWRPASEARAARCSTALEWLDAEAGARRAAATGSRGGRTCGPAAGRSSMPIRTIPMSTTPPWWSMAMDRAQGAIRRRSSRRDRARAANGSSACRARTAAGARSMPTTNIYYLNNIPFADHGALLDPPTEDVTARCVSMLAQLGDTPAELAARSRPRVDYLERTQLAGRQLVRPLGHELHLRHLVGAVRAQRRRRRSRSAGDAQGGATGWSRSRTPMAAGARTARATSSTTAATSAAPSTASQTAWALLGLMAAGEVDHPAVQRGIDYLHAHAGRRRLLGRGALHRDRFPARVLSALPRLCEILPALGAGALSQSQERQCARGCVRDVAAIAPKMGTR